MNYMDPKGKDDFNDVYDIEYMRNNRDIIAQ